MSLLDQLSALPERVTVRARTVPAWVKIVPSNNPLKPKVKLSSTSVELIKSHNDYVLFRESEGSLYIVTPSTFSTTGDPNKSTDTRVTATNTLEITKAVIETWGVDLGKYHGEYTLELQGEEEIKNMAEEVVTIKIFKLVPNGNSNESSNTELQGETTFDGVSLDESEVDRGESTVSDDQLSDGGDDGSDELLSENQLF